MEWKKDIAQWEIGKNLYLSIPFTWMLPKAKIIAKNYKGKVFAGGPAVSLLPEYLKDVADIESISPIPPLMMHNPLATFTTRGCPNHCGFCAVPKIDGEFREIDTFPIRPIVCDNNLLASSRKHFDKVIDALKALPFVDFNQGLDARLFTRYHASKIAELKAVKLRFSYDHIKTQSKVYEAVTIARSEGLKDIGIYVLFGFENGPEDAHYRLEEVLSWGIRPNPMRYQPLDCLSKNDYVATGWTERELRDTQRYYSRLRWLEHIPFGEYKHREQKSEQLGLFTD